VSNAPVSLARLPRYVIVDVGKTGMGKTVWARQFLHDKPRCIIMDPQDEYRGVLFSEPDPMLDFLEKNPHTFRVRTDRVDLLDVLCRASMGVGRVWLVIDESQRALPGSGFPLPDAFLDVLYRGRHRNVNVLLIAQRASTINIAARSQWTRIISFRQTETQDTKWIEGQAGEPLALADLPQFGYYDVAPDGVKRATVTLTKGGAQ
jgi:hypothetical protein